MPPVLPLRAAVQILPGVEVGRAQARLPGKASGAPSARPSLTTSGFPLLFQLDAPYRQQRQPQLLEERIVLGRCRSKFLLDRHQIVMRLHQINLALRLRCTDIARDIEIEVVVGDLLHRDAARVTLVLGAVAVRLDDALDMVVA